MNQLVQLDYDSDVEQEELLTINLPEKRFLTLRSCRLKKPNIRKLSTYYTNYTREVLDGSAINESPRVIVYSLKN
jgi:hypothetical protein